MIPPVGQKRICGNGPANAFSALMPPTTSAGNSFAWVIPRSSSATISDAVADARQERDAAGLQRVEQRRRRARGDEEARAGGERVVDLTGAS